MTPNDVLILKCYDSASRRLTNVTPSDADVALDPAIDVRALVFYD